MKKLNTLLLSVLLTLGLFLSQMTLFAQHGAFSQDFANLVSEDSRPGWIKVKSNQQLNATDFLGNLTTGLGFTEKFAFSEEKNTKDKYGNIHRLYQLTYQDVPVENHAWLLHEKNRNVFLAQGHEMPIFEELPASPSLTESAALNIILTKPDTLGFKQYAWQDKNMERDLKLVRNDNNATHFPKGDLLWVKNDKTNLYVLAYAFDIFVVKPLSKKRYYVNAHNQELIKEIDLIATNCFAEDEDHQHTTTTTTKGTVTAKRNFFDTPASGHANYVTANNGIVNFTADDNGTDFTLKASNLGPNNSQVVHTLSANNNYDFDNLTEIRDADNNWQDDSIAIGAHWGTEKVYDYFLTKHNRNSFDGNGAPLISYVHFGDNYVNAFWNGVNMTYGDGNGTNWGALTSFDVIAHEITHGVTENNGLNGLVYYSESGALNESFSDIFGVVFEFEYHPDGGDWLMGEDFDLANQEGFRSMSNPQDKGHPKTYYGTNWYTGFGDNAGVHTNSGVQNFWFYLLANGGSGTNEYQYTYNVTGIGMEKAAAIAYRNLTTYMSPNAEFIDARDGAIQSAIDIYGDGSAEHQATLEAWCAVAVGTTCLPEITLLTPELNNILTAGADFAITWSSTMTSIIPTVKLEYTTEAGENANWILIEDNVPNNGTYNWFVPSIYGTLVRVRVSDRGDSSTARPGHPLIGDESRIFNVLPCAGANSFTLPTSTKINVPATFTGNIPGDSFEWLINNTIVGTAQHLTYTFTDFGIFSITYRVENATDGCMNIETLNVYVYPDDVCDAQTVDLNTAYRGGFAGATTEVSEPRPPSGDCENSWCSNYLVHSLWYTFVAPESGIVSIETNGISYSSTKIALYEGINCAISNPFQDAVLLAANEYKPSRCCNGSLIEKACLVPGQTYYVQVGATYETSDFELTIKEKPIYNSVYETFAACNIPTDWTLNSGGKGIGVFSDSDNYDCIGCGIRVYGGGDVGEAYVELPYIDFTNFTNSVLIFDYGFIAQVDGEENELRIEVATDCGDYTTVFTRNGTDLLTNDPPDHSNGDFRVPTCEEIEQVQVDLSAYDGQAKVSIRIVANGQWNNPIAIDNILVDVPNDTCRMLDSLVLVDIYNATNGSGWANTWDLNEPLDSFYGVTLSPFGCVTAIDLDGSIDCFSCTNDGNNLQGTIPASTFDLLQLEYLSLSRNEGLAGGSIPTSIGNLIKLRELSLYSTGLVGSIPSEIGNLDKLTSLHLRSNQLNGLIPTSLGNLTDLTYFNVGSNQLAGDLPTSLNNLTALTYLNVSYNNFSSLPDLGDLTELENLYGSGNNFSGDLPTWLGNLTSLRVLSMSSNKWTGVIPASFANLDNIYSLNLGYNQLSGSIDILCEMDYLHYIYLYNNQLEGEIPSCLSNITYLYNFNVSYNNFSGIIPNFSAAGNLNQLEVNDNRFTFESILPYIVANESVIANNGNYDWQKYNYASQQKIGLSTSYLFTSGTDYTFDLGIDADVTDNNYKWFKDGTFLQDIVGNNALTITNASTADLGVYTCEVTNNGAPDLTLYSFSYALVETITPNDSICNATTINIDQSYTGTFLGASTEANEPNAPEGSCETTWCDSDLNGSVWYSFVAPVNPHIISA